MTKESKEKNEQLRADLYARMTANAVEAEALKFIDWQDRLNVVSL